MGPNGTGKSTLGYALMGNPQLYQVTGGSILFDGKDITELPVDERAKAGMFLSFQNPAGGSRRDPEALSSAAPWSSRPASASRLLDFKKKLKEAMELLAHGRGLCRA